MIEIDYLVTNPFQGIGNELVNEALNFRESEKMLCPRCSSLKDRNLFCDSCQQRIAKYPELWCMSQQLSREIDSYKKTLINHSN